MKSKVSLVFYGITLATVFCICIELMNLGYTYYHLRQGDIPLAEDGASMVLAERYEPKYLDTQRTAALKRARVVGLDLVKHLAFVGIASLFLYRLFRTKVFKFCKYKLTFINTGIQNLSPAELNYLSLLFGLYMLTIFLLSLARADAVHLARTLKTALIFSFVYYFVIPLLLVVAFALLNRFGGMFIVCCYVAYFLRVIPDLLIQDTADLEAMEQVDISEFPDHIQHALRKEGLADSVYRERVPGDEVNAALIGFGSGKRLEIYGEMGNYSNDELLAILLHEVGHVDEKSLLRKTTTYFCILLAELFGMLLLYNVLAPKYSDEHFSVFTCFVALFLIYRILVRQWPMSVHKFVSQNSELVSDMYAKKYGMGEELATGLFRISIDSGDFLDTTYAYNLLRSTHPSIITRVERLFA